MGCVLSSAACWSCNETAQKEPQARASSHITRSSVGSVRSLLSWPNHPSCADELARARWPVLRNLRHVRLLQHILRLLRRKQDSEESAMQRVVDGPPRSEACPAAPARPSAPAIQVQLRSDSEGLAASAMQRIVAGPPGSEARSAAPAHPSAPAMQARLRRPGRQCHAKDSSRSSGI